MATYWLKIEPKTLMSNLINRITGQIRSRSKEATDIVNDLILLQCAAHEPERGEETIGIHRKPTGRVV